VCALMLVVSALAVLWLLRQLDPVPAEREIILEGASPEEAVSVSAQAAADAFARDVAAIEGVGQAGARVRAGTSPRVVDLWVEVGDGASVASVRNRISEHALPRLTRALGDTNIETVVEFRPAELESAVRVR